MAKAPRRFMADFETTVFDGQQSTEVWAAALVEIKPGATPADVIVDNSLEGFLKTVKRVVPNGGIVYFHNLKFDGHFLLSHFIYSDEYSEGWDEDRAAWKFKKELSRGEYTYSVSDKGTWYKITASIGGRRIEFRDSLKLLPFSVRKIGDGFQTEHRKTSIVYEGERHAGGVITPDEREYIANDVLVVAEALLHMFREGHDRLTIGSCCLAEYKTMLAGYLPPKKAQEIYRLYFPDLYEIPTPAHWQEKTADEWLRKSYRGGWCYVVEGKRGRVLRDGITLDVNSLYPYVMLEESGNAYPVGEPKFFDGAVPEWLQMSARAGNAFYFVHIKTRFRLRSGYLPFMQIKGSAWYKGNEMLKTSDFWHEKSHRYYAAVTTPEGERYEMRPDLYMTWSDYDLFREHYELYDTEEVNYILFGHCYRGLFDDYIGKYRKMKETSTGPKRTEAKLFSNNLYGKMGASTDSGFKRAEPNPDGTMTFRIIDAHDKEPGYVAVGSAITSYARCYTIRAAQKNYHGPDKPGFAYADTDSLHLDGMTLEQVQGVRIHDTSYGGFKHEASWRRGIFSRQKGYLEEVTTKTGHRWNVVCAGMPERAKVLVNAALTGDPPTDEHGNELALYDDEKEFIAKGMTIADFDVGLEVPGSLKARQLPGGVVLQRTTYKMRDRVRL